MTSAPYQPVHMAESTTRRAPLDAPWLRGAPLDDPAICQRLEVLLESCETQARLNAAGWRVLRTRVLRQLASRRAVREYVVANPGFAGRPLPAPIVITGLPRTGTTLLHNLLALDRNNQVLTVWQALYPLPADAAGCRPRDELLERAGAWLQFMYALAPNLRTMHPLTPEGPEECDALLGLDFVDEHLTMLFDAPDYARLTLSADLGVEYERFANHLRILARGGRWVLKSPGHMRHIPALLQAMPGATVVQCHRDPLEAIPSTASLVTTLREPFSIDASAARTGPQVFDRWAEIMAGAMRARDAVGEAHFVDLSYTALVLSPIQAVETLYASLERAVNEDFRLAMEGWLARNPQGQYGHHAYSLAQYGIRKGDVDDRFATYRERFARFLPG